MAGTRSTVSRPRTSATALRQDGMLALARLYAMRLVESPYRTPQMLVGGRAVSCIGCLPRTHGDHEGAMGGLPPSTSTWCKLRRRVARAGRVEPGHYQPRTNCAYSWPQRGRLEVLRARQHPFKKAMTACQRDIPTDSRSSTAAPLVGTRPEHARCGTRQKRADDPDPPSPSSTASRRSEEKLRHAMKRRTKTNQDSLCLVVTV